jgi:hypothetical protein
MVIDPALFPHSLRARAMGWWASLLSPLLRKGFAAVLG